MVQFIEAPTRNDALLDLVISNHVELITNVQIKEHLGSSDHNMISFDVRFRQEIHTGKIKTLYFKRANFPRMRAALQDLDWGGILASRNTEQKCEFLKKTVWDLTAKYIPMGNKFKRLKIKPLWLTAKVKKAINYRKELLKNIKMKEH